MKKCNDHLAAQRQKMQDLLPDVTRLALQGFTTREIGEKMNIAHATVSRWLSTLRRERASNALLETAQVIADVTDSYWLIFHEAMSAWFDSRKKKPTAQAKEAGKEGSSEDKEPVPGKDVSSENKAAAPSTGRPGNSVFLGKAMKALKAIREIHGTDAPKRTEIAGPDGGPIELTSVTDNDLRNMSNEQLARLEREIDARILEEESSEHRSASIHDLHQSGLPTELAPRASGLEPGPRGPRPLPTVDGLHAAPTRQERVGEPPLPGLHPGHGA